MINSKGEVIATVENLDAVDGTGASKSIIKDFVFTNVDPNKLGKARDELTVRILPPQGSPYTKAEETKTNVKQGPYAVTEPIEVNKGTDLTGDTEKAKAGIANSADMPEGTTYSWKTPPNTDAEGKTTGIVLVKVPDRNKPFEVEVKINVVDSRKDNEKYEPEVAPINTEINVVPEAEGSVTNKDDLPEGTTITWKENPDVSNLGETKATIVVTYPDGSKDEVKVKIKVEKPNDGNSKNENEETQFQRKPRKNLLKAGTAAEVSTIVTAAMATLGGSFDTSRN